MTIAVTHPGKHGDALYALPAIRALCQRHYCKADFYTSAYCEPLRSLFEAQYCINAFYVAPSYKIERMDMGVQPWYVPVDASQYDAVYQLGFRDIPDIAIPDYIAREAGVELHGGIWYDLPDEQVWWDNFLKKRKITDYLVIGPRGETSYTQFFHDLISDSPVPVVIVGSESDILPFQNQETGKPLHKNALFEPVGYLETAYILNKSSGFVGLMSSQLVLANGFKIPRIAPHDGKSWDMRHVVRSRFNHYPVNPSAKDVLELLKPEHYVDSYSKTVDPEDYDRSDLFQHIQNMTSVLSGAYTPWGTEYRKWEYGMVLMALRENGAKTVLDVGGGSSMFAASAIWAGFDVTVVDPDNYSEMFREQSDRIGTRVPFVHSDFFTYPVDDQQYDAVVCISTIEHVPNDDDFFLKLLRHVKLDGLLCLTTDFHPGAIAPLYPSHLRTYSPFGMHHLMKLAESVGFEVFGGAPNYESFVPNVHGLYSFASLVMKRMK